MVEKNYDPDNENCPEKDTIENLYLQRKSEKNKNNRTVEEFTEDSPKVSKKDNPNHTDSDYYEENSSK
jgi:hypothetical protein